jgi:hypothetical protein
MGVKPKQATEPFTTSNVAAGRTWLSGQGREEKKIIFALMGFVQNDDDRYIR